MRVGVRFGTLVTLLSGLAFTPVLAKDMQGITLYETKASFDQSRQDLEDSIVNRGYVIDSRVCTFAHLMAAFRLSSCCGSRPSPR